MRSLATRLLPGLLGSLGITMILGGAAMRAQDPPPSSIREPELRRDAIVGVDIVPMPGERIEDGVIIMRDGIIEAVGSDIEIPEGYRVHDRSGLVAYPGLVEPALLLDSSELVTARMAERGAHHNGNVVPQVDMAESDISLDDGGAQLRSLGFCTAMVLPDSKIFRGRGTVVLLDEEEGNQRSPGGARPLALGLDATGGWRSRSYPGSSMGVVALVRQVLSDAAWHEACKQVWEEHPGLNEPPIHSVALDSLGEVISGEEPVFIDATNELRALRGARIVREFDLEGVILGNGMEFRRVDELAETGLPILVPVSYPKQPKAESVRAAEDVSLRTLLNWKHAPENARRVHDAGIDFAFTTHRLESRSAFRKNVAEAVERGLSPDDALDAMTRTPARLLEIDDVVGTLEAGRIGNIVLVEGDLLEPDDTIREVWIAGRVHEIEEEESFAFPESGTLVLGELTRSVSIDRDKNSLEFKKETDPPGEEEPAEDPGNEQPEAGDAGGEAKPAESSKSTWRARNVRFTDDTVGGVVDGEAFDMEGTIRFNLVLVGERLHGVGEKPDGSSLHFTIMPANQAGDPEAMAKDDEDAGEDGEAGDDDAAEELAALPVPLGAYGRTTQPMQETVLFENARIWTSSEAGILEDADLLITDGRIVAVGRNLDAPDGARVIDASGKQITPGLIDCHSHTGIDGSVNEGSQNNTAEVRIGDVLDPDDINWYRQLAGGLTAANQLHGSANPIGGQNAVVKLRWGSPVEKMHFEDAMPGIKFALGENVVRPENRYPDTRMGVAAFMEDAFRAASEYNLEHDRYAMLPEEERTRIMPPRRDLELETLAEILASERLIHCHSYRQDEILMLLRTAERWGFTIGTLQHVLEGYKVAEAIAAHGAGASSFSDWWAYKMEVMDAIPHNGTLMTNVGVLASFNSDSDELARRMNTEAAKAVRYGGLDPHQALMMVTINPARQLRIDERTGSLEPGKDADLVVWNGDPLSTLTRCEQTWVDGALYFDIQEDRRLAEQAHARRGELLAELVTPEQSQEPDQGEAEGRGGRRMGPPGGGPPGWRRRARPQSPPVESRGETLLSRMLDAREDYLFEMLRSGLDPEEIRPGACGCDEGTAAMQILKEAQAR